MFTSNYLTAQRIEIIHISGLIYLLHKNSTYVTSVICIKHDSVHSVVFNELMCGESLYSWVPLVSRLVCDENVALIVYICIYFCF